MNSCLIHGNISQQKWLPAQKTCIGDCSHTPESSTLWHILYGTMKWSALPMVGKDCLCPVMCQKNNVIWYNETRTLPFTVRITLSHTIFSQVGSLHLELAGFKFAVGEGRKTMVFLEILSSKMAIRFPPWTWIEEWAQRRPGQDLRPLWGHGYLVDVVFGTLLALNRFYGQWGRIKGLAGIASPPGPTPFTALRQYLTHTTTMQNYITTSLVGGRDGEIFQDIFLRTGDGEFNENK